MYKGGAVAEWSKTLPEKEKRKENQKIPGLPQPIIIKVAKHKCGYLLAPVSPIDLWTRCTNNYFSLQEKKEPLLMLPLAKKREMLSMNSRNMARTKFQSPSDYIEYLSCQDLSLQKKYSCIESLRVALTNNSLEWIQEFGTRGLKQVLSLLNECSDSRR